MARRVLIVEKDKELAGELLSVLHRQDLDTISIVPTMREACLILAQDRQELAFIPAEDAESLADSLWALQPDLPMVLLVASGSPLPNNRDGRKYQAMLRVDRLQEELPIVLANALPEAETLTEVEGQTPNGNVELPYEASPLVSSAWLQILTQEVGLTGEIALAVCSKGSEVLAQAGKMDLQQAEIIAARLATTWSLDNPPGVQIQYLQLPDYYDPILLYSRQVGEFLLTLAAATGTPVSHVRHQHDRLAAIIETSLAAETVGEERADEVTVVTVPKRRYVLAWQAAVPLSANLQLVICRLIQRLAVRKGYRLEQCQIGRELVRLLFEPPAKGQELEAVQLFKNGVEKAIKAQFRIPEALWHPAYYYGEARNRLPDDVLLSRLAQPDR